MRSIKIDGVFKSFGEKVALNNINLSINSGEIFGLIGPDGAGKTSLFEMMVTLSKPDVGDITVCGYNTITDYKQLREIIGYMPGKFSLYQDLSVEENLKFFADIFSTSIKEGYDIIKDIWIQIEPFRKRKAGKLSGGMKQKLALCCALVHQPQVLFLDEPTTGVDPVSRKEFWQILKNLKEKGITIFASTPYMDEAVLCDKIALIQQGEIMGKIDTPNNIIKSFGKTIYQIKSNNIHYMLIVLKKWSETHSCNAFGQSVHFVPKRESLSELEIIEFLIANKIIITQIGIIEATIEDCFMELMTQGNGNND